jgi:hypothetical protein
MRNPKTMNDHELLAEIFLAVAQLKSIDEECQPCYLGAVTDKVAALRQEFLSRMDGEPDDEELLNRLVGPVADSLNEMAPESIEVRELREALTTQLFARIATKKAHACELQTA